MAGVKVPLRCGAALGSPRLAGVWGRDPPWRSQSCSSSMTHGESWSPQICLWGSTNLGGAQGLLWVSETVVGHRGDVGVCCGAQGLSWGMRGDVGGCYGGNPSHP